MSVNRQLTRAVHTIRVSNAAANAGTEIDGASVDLTNPMATAVRFVAAFGAVSNTTNTLLKIQSSSDNSNWADITGTTVAFGGAANGSGANLVLISDLYRPVTRYVRPVILRPTNNCAVDAILAELYLTDHQPVNNETLDTSVSAVVMAVGS